MTLWKLSWLFKEQGQGFRGNIIAVCSHCTRRFSKSRVWVASTSLVCWVHIASVKPSFPLFAELGQTPLNEEALSAGRGDHRPLYLGLALCLPAIEAFWICLHDLSAWALHGAIQGATCFAWTLPCWNLTLTIFGIALLELETGFALLESESLTQLPTHHQYLGWNPIWLRPLKE